MVTGRSLDTRSYRVIPRSMRVPFGALVWRSLDEGPPPEEEESRVFIVCQLRGPYDTDESPLCSIYPLPVCCCGLSAVCVCVSASHGQSAWGLLALAARPPREPHLCIYIYEIFYC